MKAALAAALLFGFVQHDGSARTAAPAGFRFEGVPLQSGLMRGTAPAGTVSLALDGAEVPLAADGRFLLGFDRDRTGEALLVARLADGREIAGRLSVAPRQWPIEHVALARRPGGPSEDFMRRREPELARIAAARARRTDSAGWTQRFVWPARGRISGRFGAQRIFRGEPGAYHSGVDIGAGAGAAVVAPADGVVTLAPPPDFSLEGNLVIIDHGLGLSSAFLHLAAASVRPGQRVRQGQVIGTVGATGRATGPHLHWGMMWNGARIDPELLVGTGSN